MVEKNSDVVVGGEMLVGSPPAADHHCHQKVQNHPGGVGGVVPPVTDDLPQVVVGDTGKHAARVAVEGFAVLEPPLDAEAATERRSDVAALLAGFAHQLQERTTHHLGYPYNLDFDFSTLAHFQSFSINNLGDPSIESNYGVHSRQFEVAVLDWFARLWDIPQDEYWGYIM